MQRPPLYVRLLGIFMTCVVCGLGLIALYSGHAPARNTRFGQTAELDGSPAMAFGLSIFLFGLLPLMLTLRTPRAVMIFSSIVGTLGVLSVFLGIRGTS